MSILYQQNFDALTAGQIAPGWSNHDGADFVVSGTGAARKFGNSAPTSLALALYDTPATDPEATFRFEQVISGNNSLGGIFRSDAAGENFYTTLIDPPNSLVYIFKRTGGGGNYALLLNVPFACSNGDTVYTLISPVGTNLRFKMWRGGEAEPSGWTGTVTDTSFAGAGRFGLLNSGASGTPAVADNVVMVQAGAAETALTLGNILCTSSAATSASIELPAPTGGDGTYAYQWHRSLSPAFAPDSSTALAGATSRTLSQSGLTQGTRYFYKCVVTSGTQTATSYERPIRYTAPIPTLSPRQLPASISVASIGDSIETAYVGNSDKAVIEYIAENLTALGVTVTVTNRAIAGTAASDWVAGSANMNAALTAIPANSIVFVRLGMNSAQGGVSAATLGSQMGSAVGAVAGAGHKVILSYPTYREPGSHAPTNPSITFDESTTPLLIQYQGQLDALINGTTVLAGDKASFDLTAAFATTLLYDRIHPNVAGTQSMAARSSAAYLASLPAGAALSASVRRLISRTLTSNPRRQLARTR